MNKVTAFAWSTIATLALLAGCSKDEPKGTTGASSAAATAPVNAEAKQKWDTLCATCHGADGKGNGAAGAALNPKPRDFTDKAWQAQVTDDQISKAILKGGTAVGKSATMPPAPDLETKPEVVKGLVALVRQSAKK